MVKLSISQKIVIPTVALIALLQLGLAALMLDHEKNTLLAELDARAASLSHLSETIALNTGKRNASEIAEQLGRAVVQQDGILSCTVKGEGDATLFHSGLSVCQNARDYGFPITLRTSSEPAGGPTESYNTVIVSFSMSTADVTHALTEARAAVVVAILSGIATSVLLIILIVRYVVRKPATRLLEEIRNASIGHPRSVPRRQTGDELDQLAEALHIITKQLQFHGEKDRRLATRTTSEPSEPVRAMN